MRPLLTAFARAAADWWYGLIPFAVVNLLWFGCVLTVVAGPPATAALLAVARDAAVGQGAEPSTFFWTLRRLFWRSWALGLITAAGTLFLLVDLRFYSEALQGAGLFYSLGIGLLGYIFLIWCEAVLIAWPLLVNQPEMALRDLLRNTAVFTLRYPGTNLGLALIVAALAFIGVLISFLIPVAIGAFVALLLQHYLHEQAPLLAAWPPRPGEPSSEF